MELDGKVLVIRRIHTSLTLRGVTEPEHKDTIERVHGFFADYCPVARSIKDSIEITTSYALV